jgi:leader peptidase (prepilin peptidase)/N-methyltransferase
MDVLSRLPLTLLRASIMSYSLCTVTVRANRTGDGEHRDDQTTTHLPELVTSVACDSVQPPTMNASDVMLRLAIALPLGLVFGSFLTVAIRRVPAGEPLVRPRSRCPSCSTELRAVDYVPLHSWLALRGRCYHCGAPIPAVYPLSELGCGALFVAVGLVYEDPWQAVLLAPFLGLMVGISVIDLRHYRIPDRLVYPAIQISAAFVVVGDLAGAPLSVIGALVGMLAYGAGLLMVALIAPTGMGMGDVKFAGMIGLVLGAVELSLVAAAAGTGILLGGVGAIVALLLGAGRKTRMPYGPYMAGGAAVAVFAGEAIVNAYLSPFT